LDLSLQGSNTANSAAEHHSTAFGVNGGFTSILKGLQSTGQAQLGEAIQTPRLLGPEELGGIEVFHQTIPTLGRILEETLPKGVLAYPATGDHPEADNRYLVASNGRLAVIQEHA